jgi:hypothetical protein
MTTDDVRLVDVILYQAKIFSGHNRSMTRLVWVNGRFGWPLIMALVFLTISMVAADFVWRLLVIPFEKLAAYAIAIDALAAALVICAYVLVFKNLRNTKRQ